MCLFIIQNKNKIISIQASHNKREEAEMKWNEKEKKKKQKKGKMVEVKKVAEEWEI